jgi:hypothetical protein
MQQRMSTLSHPLAGFKGQDVRNHGGTKTLRNREDSDAAIVASVVAKDQNACNLHVLWL